MLTIKTVKAATQVATGKLLTGRVSAGSLALAEEAMSGMLGIKGKLVLMVLALGLAVGGAGWAGYGGLGEQPQPGPAQAPEAKNQAGGPAKKERSVATDQYSDPLPEGAFARLGTVRFRQYGSMGVAFVPGGKVLAASGLISGVRFWDAATGQPDPWLPGVVGSKWVVFSPDGKLVASRDLHWVWSIWSIAERREVRRLKGLPSYIVFSPDGKLLAGALPDPSTEEYIIQVWDVGTGEMLLELKGRSGNTPFEFSPDGKTIAAGSKDTTIHLWDVATGREVRQFEGNEPHNWSLAFSPDGRMLVSGGRAHVIRAWDVATGKLVHQMKGDESINLVYFSPDGKTLASAGFLEGTIRLWDPQTGKELRHWDSFHRGQISLAFSPDGKVLASASQGDSVIRRWDTSTGKEINPAAPGATLVSIAPNGKTVLTFGTDRKVLEWDVSTGRPHREFPGGALGPGGSWALRPDARVLAMIGGSLRFDSEFRSQYAAEPLIRLLDTATGKQIRSLQRAHGDSVLKFSPDGRLLASVGDDGIRLWNVELGRELRHLPGKGSVQTPLAFSEDGKFFASSWDYKSVWLWDVASGKELRRLEANEKTHQLVLAFSPDGQSLVSYAVASDLAERRSVFHVWSTSTGKELMRFGDVPHGLYARSLGFSASGRILAAGDETHIYLWDVHLGQLICRFDGIKEGIHSLIFAQDGRTLASGCGDGTVLLWDMTGRSRTDNAGPARLTAEDLQALWGDLAAEAVKADRAIWLLARAPRQSLPFLEARLKPVAPPDMQIVAKLLRELDSDQFANRDRADKALEKMGEAVEGALREALDRNPTLEVRLRLERILNQDKEGKEVIRRLRATETVEHIGTSQARELLGSIAKGTPNPRVAKAAAAARRRITTQTPEGR
jgi:WD40 repeat protein